MFFRSTCIIYSETWRRKHNGLGFMSWERVGKLDLIEAWKMDKYVYCNILETKLVGTIQMRGLEED